MEIHRINLSHKCFIWFQGPAVSASRHPLEHGGLHCSLTQGKLADPSSLPRAISCALCPRMAVSQEPGSCTMLRELRKYASEKGNPVQRAVVWAGLVHGSN